MLDMRRRSNASRPVRGALVLGLLALAGLATSCAKRPATTQVAAPAPAGVASAPAAPPPAPPVAPAPQPLGPAPAQPPAVQAPAPVAPPPAPETRSAPTEYVEQPALADIHFDFDRSDIRPGDARILDASARWLTENPGVLVLIEGHCDERGTNEYNLALGERRAQAAKAYLARRGVQASRISIVSYGEERPVCTDRTEACWARNRRARFLTRSR